MTDKIEIKEHQLVETQTITKVAVQVIQLVLEEMNNYVYCLLRKKKKEKKKETKEDKTYEKGK